MAIETITVIAESRLGIFEREFDFEQDISRLAIGRHRNHWRRTLVLHRRATSIGDAECKGQGT